MYYGCFYVLPLQYVRRTLGTVFTYRSGSDFLIVTASYHNTQTEKEYLLYIFCLCSKCVVYLVGTEHFTPCTFNPIRFKVIVSIYSTKVPTTATM